MLSSSFGHIKYLPLLLLLFSFLPLRSYGQRCKVDSLLDFYNDGGKSSRVLIFAHRGDWRHAPENSLKAFKHCIDGDIDGIEIDLQMTKDSVLIIMHDETLDRTTTGKGKVSDFTLAEIRELFLKSPIGVKTRQKIPTFEEVLTLCKDQILIQVDKWKPYKREVIEIARKHNCERQLIIRGTVTSDVFEKDRELFQNIQYIPVLVCKGDSTDEEKFEDFLQNFKTSVISVTFIRDDFPVLERLHQIGETGHRLWMNSLWSTFNAGYDEELAADDPQKSYGYLIYKGANIIFSDNPFKLKEYLESINRR